MSEITKNEMELITNLDQVFSVLCHELGNSLNSLNISLDVLLRNHDLFDDAKKVDYLKRCLDLTKRQKRYLDAMKIYYRADVDDIQELQFIAFWNTFLSSLRDKLEYKDIGFKLNPMIEPCWIHVNIKALNMVLANIFENAVEAVDQIKNPKIEIGAFNSIDYFKIMIKDNGCGIRKKDIPKIFIPLFTTKPGRMGIGLPIACKLLRKMGGQVKIESTFGKGTEAEVYLKIAGGK